MPSKRNEGILRSMTDTTIPIKPGNRITWEQWQAGREKRRRLGELVAPKIIRRAESSSDRRLREAFDGERGPAFPGREEA